MRPLIEGRRYDFVIDTNRTLLLAQVKWGRRLGDVIVVNTRTCRSTPSGYVRTTYSADEIDGFARLLPQPS